MVEDLTPYSKYEFQLSVVNDAGMSKPPVSTYATTLPARMLRSIHFISSHLISLILTDFLANRTIGRAFVVCLSSVTFCIVAKRYVLAKKCLKE